MNVGRVLEDPIATNLNNSSNLTFIYSIYCAIYLSCLAVYQTKLSAVYITTPCTFVVLPGLLDGGDDSSPRRPYSSSFRNIISFPNCLEGLPVLGWKCVCFWGVIDEFPDGRYSFFPKDPSILFPAILFAILLDEIVVNIDERIVNIKFLSNAH